MGLWNLQRNEGDQNKKIPLYGASEMNVGNNSDGFLVNVLDKYRWTISPLESRIDAPYIYMIEKKVTQNTIIQQAIYNLETIRESGAVTAEQASRLLEKITNLEDDSNIVEALNEAQEANGKDVKDEGTTSKESDSLYNPYKGLYALEDTGWQYVFPYFTETNRDISQSWGEASKDSFLASKIGEAIDAGENLVENINLGTAIAGALSQGNVSSPIITYIEKPKQYSYGDNTPQYSFTFHLFNTYDYEDIVKNWEICFLLIYQNLPNRRTKAIIDPPALYEVIIPGIKNSPLSYISGLRIDFVGSTRLMDLEVGSDGKKIKTIVPDAYKVTINITDLFPESKNFLEGVVDLEKRITISDEKTTFLFERDSSFEINELRKSFFENIQDTVSSAAKSVKDAISGIFGGGG
jgi:hypothetical protein